MSEIDGLRRLRCAQRLTQAELARQLSVTQSLVAQWERGAVTPSAAKLPLLADVLGCTIDELFGRAPPDRVGRESA
ncbi:MAG: helix-turn-helix transcriptional regulator [Oscillibacter sp.]|nr:helix-turn-helix transcriptional regulator [Oscillibacter sp.]